MKDIIRIVLLVINIISFSLLCIFALVGLVGEIFNPPMVEKLFAKLNISLSYGKFLLIAYICLAVLIITYFIRIKFFER